MNKEADDVRGNVSKAYTRGRKPRAMCESSGSKSMQKGGLAKRDRTPSSFARPAVAFALVAALAGGCAHKWQDLKKPERQRSFTLDKDYARTETRGIGVKWVEGLHAGVYALSAEDDDGWYFAGAGPCVIKLSGDNGEEFLKTGKSKAPLLPGGLWLPKKGVNKEAKLFYVFSGESPAPTGALVGAIVAGGKGDVIFIGYGSEKEFVNGLEIADK
jgi:hypothetical protein